MSYFLQTRSSFYSFLFTIPLFFIYEVGILFLSKDDILVVRNGADFLMRSILESFGIFGLYGLGVIFLIGFIITYIYFFNDNSNKSIRADYLFIMIFESVCWALILYFLLSKFMLALMNPIGKTIAQQVTLAVGAGIYEEFLFRVMLISGLTGIIGFVFLWSEKTRKAAALIIAAGIFSAFHFMGDYGDYFSMELFILRFFAGIVLGILYISRGFGITAYAHSIYDLIVLIQITIHTPL
ncbi:MAG: CPBP family glutamic-type intramembrane protease [Candidatus Neomarinimicrobiota bacterium]|nr:CPBP family glutamic-type intramembrane protease [Candidatus Neomarinimicrobiota bacterium]